MSRSKLNKTISFDKEYEKYAEYINKCISVKDICHHTDIDNKIIIGDFFETAKKLPKDKYDLIIVDPPYNLSKNYNGNKFNKVSSEKYIEYTHQWLQYIYPVLKHNGTVYICCDWSTSLLIAPLLPEYFDIKNRITWQREKGRGSERNWKNSSEDIWYCVKGKDYTFNVDAIKHRRRVIAPYVENGEPKDWRESKESKRKFRDTYPSNLWDDISVPFWSMSENTEHPTQKPEKLIAKLILASSNEGDMVLDPFAGSGTTAVVAKKLNRNYTVIEREEKYCAWAQHRLEMAVKNPKIQGYDDGVFYPRNINNL